MATRSRPSLGVTLTHSGSFISNVSKQPTPAPSTPDESPPENPFDSVATNENGLGPMTDESAGLNPDGDEDGDGTVDKVKFLHLPIAMNLTPFTDLRTRGIVGCTSARDAETRGSNLRPSNKRI